MNLANAVRDLDAARADHATCTDAAQRILLDQARPGDDVLAASVWDAQRRLFVAQDALGAAAAASPHGAA